MTIKYQGYSNNFGYNDYNYYYCYNYCIVGKILDKLELQKFIMKTKIKSKNIFTKRLRITKKGKVLRAQGFKRHLNAKKSSSRKRALGRIVKLNEIHAKKVRKIMGIRKQNSN